MDVVIEKNEAANITVAAVSSSDPTVLVTGLTLIVNAYTKTGTGAWQSVTWADSFGEISGSGIYALEITAVEATFDQAVVKVSDAGSAMVETVLNIRAGTGVNNGLTDREHGWIKHRIGIRNDEDAPAVNGDGDIIDSIGLLHNVSTADIRVQSGLSLVDANLHYLGLTPLPDSNPWPGGTLLSDLFEFESSTGAFRFTEDSLFHAGGGGGSGDWTPTELANLRWIFNLDGGLTKTQPPGWTTTVQTSVDNVTSLEGRLTTGRADNLDALAITGLVASAADIAGLNNLSASEVEVSAGTAIETYRLHELMHTALTAQPVSGSLMGDLTEDDGGTQRFTTNALENAPTGSGGSGDWSPTEIEQIRYALGLTGTKRAPEDTGLIWYAAAGGLRQRTDNNGLQTVYAPGGVTAKYTRQFKIPTGSNFVPGTTEPVEVTEIDPV